MAISPEQAAQVAAAYNAGQASGDLSGVQGLVNQFGVTAADVEQYYPGFDVATHAPGITLADIGGGGSVSPDPSSLVSNAYSSIGFTDTSDPNYGAGLDYWTGQLTSGAISPEDFTNTFLTAASGVTDPNYAQYVNQAKNLLAAPATPTPEEYGLSGLVLAGDSWLSNPYHTSNLEAITGQKVTNVAQGGSTSADVLNKLNTFLAEGGTFAPGTTVALNTGGNDMLQGIDPNVTFENINQTAAILKNLGVNVVLSGAPNVNSLEQLTGTGPLALSDIYSRIAEANENVSLVDAMAGLLRQSNLLDESGFHLNQVGMQAFDAALANEVRRLTGQDPLTYGQDMLGQYMVDNNLSLTQALNLAPYHGIDTADITSAFNTQFNNQLTNTFGDEASREAFADMLAERQGIDPSRVSFSDIFNPEDYADSSFSDIASNLQSSQVNKLQEAIKVSNIAKEYFGFDDETSGKVLSDLMAGESDSELANKVFDELLRTNTISDETGQELLRSAASINPNAPIFQQNPNLYAVYSPLGERKEAKDTAGQYGYYNNAPILSASEVDKVLNGKNLSVDFRSGRTDENAMGWDLHSRDAGRIANGVAIFGVTADKNQAKRYADLEDNLAQLGQIRYIEPSGDNSDYYVVDQIAFDENGNPYTYSKDITSEIGGVNNYQAYQEEKSKLDNAAAKLGLDPAEYDNFEDLYDAVQDKSKDLYSITGRTVGWDPNVAEKVGIETLTADAGNNNHASVLYKREGDKLLAISDPTIFTANDKKRSGFAAQMAPWALPLAILTLPLGGVGGALAQGIGTLAGTTMPAYAASLLNAAYGTAMSGGDFNDFTRNLLTQGATDFMSTQFTSGLQDLVKDGTISADLAKELGKTGAGAVATLAREGDLGDYAMSRGANYLFDQALSKAAPALGLDTKNMSATDKVLLSTLLPAVVKGQMSEKDLLKMLGKVAKAKE